MPSWEWPSWVPAALRTDENQAIVGTAQFDRVMSDYQRSQTPTFWSEVAANTGISGIGKGQVIGELLNLATGWKETALEREAFEYNKEVQKAQWEREDSASQRKVADLVAAGMSPVLAGSTGSPSTAMRLTAPKHYGREAAGQLAAQIASILSLREGLFKSQAERKLIDAQIGKVNAETSSILQSTQFGAELHPGNLRRQLLDNEALARTMESRIRQAVAAADTAEWKALIAKVDHQLKVAQVPEADWKASLAQLNLWWHEKHASGRVAVDGMDYVPKEVMEIVAKQTTIDLMERERAWLPVKALAGPASSILGGISPLIQKMLFLNAFSGG